MRLSRLASRTNFADSVCEIEKMQTLSAQSAEVLLLTFPIALVALCAGQYKLALPDEKQLAAEIENTRRALRK